MKKSQAIHDAKRRVDRFDAIDRQHGLATPQAISLQEVAATSAAACGAALSLFERGDTKQGIECVAEALVMLSIATGKTL